MSAFFDFPSLLVLILLFICSAAFTRSLYPNIFGLPNQHSGFYGIAWKASRIGERLSPYVAIACVIMAVHILFFK
jgi:hypothetical protein